MARETREEAAQQARMERATHVGASTAMAWVVLAICLVLELLVVLVNLVREATGDTGYMTRAFVGHMTREALAEMAGRTGLAQRLAMVVLVFDGLPSMLSIAVRSKREHISLPSLSGARLVVFFMMRACRYHIVECVDAPLFVVVSLVPLLVYANVLALKLLPPALHAADVCQAQ